jgi:hypothetical protein
VRRGEDEHHAGQRDHRRQEYRDLARTPLARAHDVVDGKRRGDPGHHPPDLRGHLVLVREAELQRIGAAERETGAHHPERLPAAEDHRDEGEEAAPRGHLLVEDADLDDGEVGAAQSGQPAGGQHARPAHAPDADPRRVGTGGQLARGPDRQPPFCAVEQEPRDRDEQERQVQRPVVLEQGRPEVRNRRQHWDLQVADDRHDDLRLVAEDLVKQVARQPYGSQVDADAGDDLIGLGLDREQPHHDREDEAAGNPGQHADEEAVRLPRHQVGEEGAGEHEALEPDVEDPGALGDQLAHRREQDRRGQHQGGGQPRGVERADPDLGEDGHLLGSSSGCGAACLGVRGLRVVVRRRRIR